MGNDPTDWRARARARMDELGIRQEDLLEPLGVVTRGAVGHYLSGRREPSVQQFQALAERLQFSCMDELLDGRRREAEHGVCETVVEYESEQGRRGTVLIEGVLNGVLQAIGLRISKFEFDEKRGLRLAAEWEEVRPSQRPQPRLDDLPNKKTRPTRGRKTRSA